MNCFPCRGPVCTSCGKFDRIMAMVANGDSKRCSLCGGRVDLVQGICVECGHREVPPPGKSQSQVR